MNVSLFPRLRPQTNNPPPHPLQVHGICPFIPFVVLLCLHFSGNLSSKRARNCGTPDLQALLHSLLLHRSGNKAFPYTDLLSPQFTFDPKLFFLFQFICNRIAVFFYPLSLPSFSLQLRIWSYHRQLMHSI